VSLLRRERLHNPAIDIGAHIRIANGGRAAVGRVIDAAGADAKFGVVGVVGGVNAQVGGVS